MSRPVRAVLAAALLMLAAAGARAGCLSATVFVNPTRISVGQTASVVVDVFNCGPALASNVTPCGTVMTGCAIPDCLELVSSGGSGAVAISGPSPSCAASLAPSGHGFYTWQVRGTAPGTVTVRFTATGSGAGATLATRPLTVQRPAALSATLSASSVKVNLLKTVTVYLDVQNVGEASAKFAFTLSQTLSGAGTLTPLPCPLQVQAPLCACCPAPADPSRLFADISGGSSTRYRWVFRADALGPVTIRSAAAARDGNLSTLTTLSPAAELTVTVFTPGQLAVAFSGPAQAVQGQPLDLDVQVTSSTSICHERFAVTVDGSTQAVAGHEVVLERLTDALLPQCYAAGRTRTYTLRVRLAESAPEGPRQLGVSAVGSVRASCQSPCASLPGDPAAYSAPAVRPLQVLSCASGIRRVSPNPLRPSSPGMTVQYAVCGEQAGRPVSLAVYTITGERVRQLVDAEPGTDAFTVTWDGRTEDGEPAASGTYLLLFKGHALQQVEKIAVLR